MHKSTDCKYFIKFFLFHVKNSVKLKPHRELLLTHFLPIKGIPMKILAPIKSYFKFFSWHCSATDEVLKIVIELKYI